MADIICRCGEPWDSTGGLHFTHSDLPWHSYDQLIRGMGCPCCEGKFKPSISRDLAWRESLEALSEGLKPFDGWPEPTAPNYGEVKNNKFIYVPRECPPSFRDLDSDFLNKIGDLASMKVKMDGDEEFEGPSTAQMPAFRSAANILETGFWIRFHPERIRTQGSIAGRVNYDAVMEKLNAMRKDNIRVYTYSENSLYVCVANNYGGKVEVFLPVVEFLLETTRGLENYPILDDLAFSEAECKAKDKIWDEVVEDHLTTLSEWAGMPEKPMRLLIESTRYSDDLPEQLDDKIEIDDAGHAQRQPSLADLEKALLPDLEPVNATLVVSDYDPSVYLLRTPTSHDFGKPTNPGDLVGYVLRDHGKGVNVEITTNMASHCFEHQRHVRWKDIPDRVRETTITLLSAGHL